MINPESCLLQELYPPFYMETALQEKAQWTVSELALQMITGSSQLRKLLKR
jgi:hypothetical protein